MLLVWVLLFELLSLRLFNFSHDLLYQVPLSLSLFIILWDYLRRWGLNPTKRRLVTIVDVSVKVPSCDLMILIILVLWRLWWLILISLWMLVIPACFPMWCPVALLDSTAIVVLVTIDAGFRPKSHRIVVHLLLDHHIFCHACSIDIVLQQFKHLGLVRRVLGSILTR